MRFNKYYPFALIYFFVNAVGLPFGMLYTILLTPLFYVWLLVKRKKLILIKYFIVATPFIINHLIHGVDQFQYWRSVVLYFTVYIFCYTFYTFIRTYDDLSGIFKKILVINFILTLLAFAFLSTPYRHFFWLDWSLEFGGFQIENWPRLIMFTYEASYYSTLLVPVFAYYFIKYVLKQLQTNAFVVMLMVTLPLIASFSMGVIGGLILSMGLLFLVNTVKVLRSKAMLFSFLAVSFSLVIIFFILLIFYRDNPFFVRIIAIVAGADSSANGRTVDAFKLAYIIADLKSIWWGIGFGQLKIIGDSVIKTFYHYPEDYGQVSIPCAFAETLALFGIVGAAFRLFVELFLFYSTRVLSNYYRTFLFIFIFIYQFTGSFTTNIAEYVIWILAFTNVFPQFDKRTNAGTIQLR